MYKSENPELTVLIAVYFSYKENIFIIFGLTIVFFHCIFYYKVYANVCIKIERKLETEV